MKCYAVWLTLVTSEYALHACICQFFSFRAHFILYVHIYTYIESGCIKSECDMFWVECRNKHGYNCSWFVYIHQSVAPVLAHKRAYATGQAHSIKTTHFNGRARTRSRAKQWLIKMLFPSSIENHFFNYNQTSLFNLIWKVSFFSSSSLSSWLSLFVDWHCDLVCHYRNSIY